MPKCANWIVWRWVQLRRLGIRLTAALLLLCLAGLSIPKGVGAAWDVTVNIDGTTVQEPDSSMRPYIDPESNRVMLSTRSVATALGGGVDWVRYHDGTIRVTVRYRDREVNLWTGRSEAQVDGRWHDLYAAPVLTDHGRVFLGMRDLFDLLEVAVKWDGENRIASASTRQVEVMDAAEFERVERYFAEHNLLWERFVGDVPVYEVGDLTGDDGVTFPVAIRPHHVAQYVRSLEDANYMTDSYENMYAYADPPTPILPTGSGQLSDSVLARPELASAAALSAQRSLAREQARASVNSEGRRPVDALSHIMRRYRTPDGVFVEVTPGGERQWLDKATALELYHKFDSAGSFSTWASTILFGTGGLALGIKSLAKAWPYGTLFAGVVVGAYAWYYNQLAKKIKDVCLPGGGDKGIVYIQKFIRTPAGIWSLLEESYRDEAGMDRRVGRVILAIPATCHAWNGGKPW